MSAPPPMNSQTPPAGLKTHFKTPDGRYKLQYEKTHPAGLLHLSHGKAVSQLTIAYLKEKPANHPSQSAAAPASGVVRSAAARLLGTSNGSRTLSFVPSAKSGSRTGSSYTATLNGATTSNYDGKGTYLVFNSGDTLFISDLNSPDKDPVKAIHFSNSNPVCHAFDPDAKDGHDLLIGLHSGDVYSVSLRQQLQDLGKKLVGAQPYNKDGVINTSRCTCVAWVPEGDGSFVVAHADGNLYAYEKNKDGTADCSFPVIKDQIQFAVSHARSSKSNPIARWHVCQGPINNISFSTDGTHLATVGRDGYLRVFDYSKEQLICGGKSYYGALLCCAWSSDGKYILTGGEDDLVQVWSMEDRRIVAWGEGHNSWVSGVAFDSYWLAPNSDEAEENVVYRFGSVGQDTQLLLWDLALDEIAVPLRGPPGGSPSFRNPPGGSPSFRNPPGGSPSFRNPSGGSPTFSNGSHSTHWDSICPVGTLQPAPRMQDVPKLSPLIAHRVHIEPLSGLMFTKESLLTICREGHIKIWARPDTVTSQAPRR